MMTGCVTMGLVFYAFVVITDNKIELKRFKQRHPALCVLAMSTCLYLIGQMINGLLVFTFGLLMPVLCEYYIKCLLAILLLKIHLVIGDIQ